MDRRKGLGKEWPIGSSRSSTGNGRRGKKIE